MKKIIFIFFILNSLTIFSQTNFDRGFSEGYKKGFCQDKGIGCMEPIPPIAPIPEIGEDMNSYNDGYNRGFKMGLQQQNSSDDGRKRYQTSKAQFVEDFIYNPYKDMNIVDLKMKAISAIMDRAVTNYNNGNYDDVISNANDLIGIQNDFAIAYYLKSIAYFKKGEILNSYNNGVKQYQLYNSAERKKWFDQIYEFTEDYLKQELANEIYNKVKYFCENVWSKNNLSNLPWTMLILEYDSKQYRNRQGISRKDKPCHAPSLHLRSTAVHINKTIYHCLSSQRSHRSANTICHNHEQSLSTGTDG